MLVVIQTYVVEASDGLSLLLDYHFKVTYSVDSGLKPGLLVHKWSYLL